MDKILDLPLDDSIILIEMIKDNRNHEYIMQAQISMLPHMKEESRKEFLEGLFQKERRNSITLNQKTDFKAIEQVKKELGM